MTGETAKGRIFKEFARDDDYNQGKGRMHSEESTGPGYRAEMINSREIKAKQHLRGVAIREESTRLK